MVCDSVDALLFDLGNVVVEIDFNRAVAHWAAHARCEESLLRERFRHDHAYDQYERGRIDFDAYFSTLRTNLGVDISDPHLRDGWNAILIGAVPGISDLLASAAERFPLYALTNSNPEHQKYLADRFADVLRPFKQVFVSSDIGLRKPEPDAYRHVVDVIGVPASRILFFDESDRKCRGRTRLRAAGGPCANRQRRARHIVPAFDGARPKPL
jgi:glucose-1-phosphatase